MITIAYMKVMKQSTKVLTTISVERNS